MQTHAPKRLPPLGPIQFVPARNFTRGPRSGPVDLVVIHTMEAPEKPTTAENVANWFAGPGAPRASTHYNIDAESIVRSVRDEDIAWCAPGANHDGIHLEHAGYSSQGSRDWFDEFSLKMLQRSALLSAHLCRRHLIPVVWISPAGLRSGQRGITSHNNVSEAFRRSDHTDPGRAFPIQWYLRRVRQLVGSTQAPRPAQAKTQPICGATRSTAAKAQAWAKRHGATLQFVRLAPLYFRLGPLRGGVRAEVGYAQAAHETGFGRFGGVLDPSYRNPCGMKKSGGGGDHDPGAHYRFRSWELGVTAHLDHLALYAGARGYPRGETPDPRHFARVAGKAKTVEALGGKWAPSPTYGERVAAFVRELA